MVKVILNEAAINRIQTVIKDKVAFQTLQDIRIDVDREQVVPFLTGTLDDSAHSFEAFRKGDKRWELHYSAPYAIRRYYEPAEFTTQYHANATDHWLEPYKTGGIKSDWVEQMAQKNLNDAIWREL